MLGNQQRDKEPERRRTLCAAVPKCRFVGNSVFHSLLQCRCRSATAFGLCKYLCFTFLWKNMRSACIATKFSNFLIVASRRRLHRHEECAIIYDRHHSYGREYCLPAAVAFMIIMCKHIKYGRKWRFASCAHDPTRSICAIAHRRQQCKHKCAYI